MVIQGWDREIKGFSSPLLCKKARSLKLLLLLLLGVGLGGCSTFSSDRNDDELLRELDRQLQQWNEHNIDTYTYTYERNCNCEPEEAGPFEVFVLEGRVESVTYEGEPAPPDPVPPYYTIIDLFDLIEDAVNREPERTSIQFDPDFGFPLQIYIDLDLSTISADYHIDVTAFDDTTTVGG